VELLRLHQLIVRRGEDDEEKGKWELRGPNQSSSGVRKHGGLPGGASMISFTLLAT